MSIELKDGPCKGTFLVKRAPVYLRAVKDQKGKTDVLDQPDDRPKGFETVYVYEREGSVGSVHINAVGAKGWYALGIYHHLPDVAGEALRDNVKWQAWATARFAAR